MASRVVTEAYRVCSLSGRDSRVSSPTPTQRSSVVSDDKARDILGELESRSPCGEGLVAKVGRRGWSRPRVSISPRLFKQYRVGDPWDPSYKESHTPIGLGPVSLRLGEKKRQPAPHLKPKEPKKPKKAALPAVPPAPRPNVPKAKAAAKPAPAAPAKSAQEMETERLAAEAAQKRRDAEAARSWPRRTPQQASSTPDSGGQLKAPLPVRPEAREAAAEREPRPASERGEVRKDGRGRFRMKPATLSRAPVVRDLPLVTDEKAEEEAPPKPRAAPARAVAGGLDDLFAAAAQQGRLRVSPPSEEEE